MKPVALGRAVVKHAETNEVYSISPEDLTWDILEIDQQQMGTVAHHEATLEHIELGALAWDVWEYPSGSLNHSESRLEAHEILENFQFDFEDELEDFFEIPTNVKVTSLTPYQQKKYLIDWFHHYYWDPANDLPYESREGGYQWIYGGPYEASEVLGDEFGNDVRHELIELAVEEIESDGLTEWSPSPNHRAQAREDDDEFYDNWLIRNVASLPRDSIISINNPDLEREKRDAFLSATREILTELNAGQDSRHRIGGNNPPDEFSLTIEELDGILGGMTRLQDGLLVDKPNPIQAAESISYLQVLWDGVKRRAGLFFDELAKSSGKAIGEWLGPKGVLWGSAAYSMFGGKLTSLVNMAVEWLQTFNWPF